MARLSAALLLFVSLAASASRAEYPLDIDDARRPDVVVAWLQRNAASADRRIAKQAFDIGVQANKRGNWSGAAKSFGESLIRYPAPRTLVERAKALHRSLGIVRAREKASPNELESDLKTFAEVYETALAADDVVHELSAADRERILSDATCVRAYLGTGQAQAGCRPLRYFAETP